MDNTPDWDALSDTPPIAPVAQDRSTPMDSQVADFADEANRRVAAGEDAATVEQDLQRKVTAAEPKTKAKASTDWDSLFDAPPRASELTSAYQPLDNWAGQVYNSPNAANAQPDAFTETGSQVQGVGDYLENLGTEAAEKLRTAGAGIVQAVGEIPQMGRDIAAKFDTLTGGVQGGVPPSAVFTAAAQAQGAPADNTLAQAGAFESEKAAKAQEQAATHLVPAPDENTGGLDQAAYYAQQALVGAPTLAGAMAAGPVGGAALFGATTAGEQYAQKRLAGEAPVSAAASSGIEGAVSALTASLSLESALNPGAIGALKRIAETTGSVEAQSVINEATSIAAEQTIDGKDISADEIKQRLIGAAKGGLPAGVLMGGIGAVAAHDPAAAAAANVERLAANLAPEAVRPTLEERVNAREIPQDQGGVYGQGIVPEGGGENRGPNVQQTAETGAEAGNAGRPVNVDQNVQPAGAERAGAQEAEGTQGAEAPEVEQGVPFMVTQAMKRDLRTAGYSDDDIRQMTPQQAHDALGAANELAAPTDVEAGRAVGADRTEAAIASGAEGIRLEPPGPLVTEAPEDEWLRVNPRKNPEAFGINRPAYPPLLEWVARAGGLNMDAFKSQYATDPAYLRDQKTNQKVVGKPLFRKNGGMTPDELREAMQQDGWLAPESPDKPAQLDNHDAFELFNTALGGKDVIHPADDNFEAMVRHVEEGQRQELEDRAVAQRLGYKNAEEMRAAHEADNRTATLYSRQQDLFGAPKELYEKAKAKRAENLDLFGGATTADAVDAAKRAKDLALRGGDTAVPMAAGEGELFAGERPEQTEIPDNLYSMAAYHGSPHDFEEFSTQHIGAGEGAQAYGHGLYFAGEKGVADYYKQALSKPVDVARKIVDAHGVDLSDFSKEQQDEYTRALMRISRSDAPDAEREQLARYQVAPVRKMDPDARLALLNEIRDSKAGVGYHVELAPEEHEYLDWDKPLSAQSEHVKQALQNTGIEIRNKNSMGKERTGADAYKDIAVKTGGGFPRASELLAEHGVRGVRYADFGSRGKDEPASHNYVIFNDRDVKILSKYAQREGAPVSDNLTKAEARDVLTKEFGATAMRKLEANGLNLVPKTAIAGHALTEQQRAGVKGFTPADRSSANIVHDNVTRAELPETAIHEVVHANLDRILPEATRNALASAIQARAQRSPEVRAALDAIPKTTPRSALKEEILAQSMGSLYTQPIGRRVMDAFKLGLNRLGVPLDWLSAHEAAIRQIGIENLRHYAESPRRAPVTTVQLAKPRVRVPVDQVPVNRTGVEDEQQGRETGGRGIPASDAGANAGAVREAGGQALPTEAGARNAAATGVREPAVHPTGAGGVVREPTEAVGISRRMVDPEQIAQGNDPLQAQGKRDFQSAWDSATQKRLENPDAPKHLVSDLLTSPRPLTAEDTSLLTQYKADISNRYDATLKAQEQARAAGDRRGEVQTGVQRKMIEEEKALFNQAAVNSGYEASLSLSIRRMLSDRDYSMVGQMAALKAIEKNGDIPDAVRKQMERYVNEHKAANDAFMKAAEADEAKATPQRSQRQRKSLDDDFARMAQELKRIAAKPETQGTKYARVEDPAMADLIRKMARNRSDAGETDSAKILDAIHDATGATIPRVDIADTITSRGTGRKHTLSELQARYNALQRELRGNPKDRARQTVLQKQLADIKSKIQRQDYDPETAVRARPQYSEPTLALERVVNEARRRMEGLKAQRERANMGIVGKSVDIITNMQMMDILLGWPVFKKLVGSVIATHISTPLTEMGVTIAKTLNPALRKYAAEAPRWGAGFKPGSLKATYGFDPRFQSASGSTLKAAFDRLLKGVTESQKQHGEYAMTHEYTDFMGNLADAWATKNGWEMARSVTGMPGRSHGFVKEFSSTPEERRGLYYRTLQMREKLAAQGWTPEQIDAYANKRSTQAMIGAGSYADGLRSKYQEDNRFNDWVNRQIGASYRYGIAGHILRGAFKIEEPVRQIAMNIVNRISSYSFGGVGAYAKARQFKGMTPEQFAKSITPEVADYIVRNNGRQMVGIPMLAFAFMGGAKIFGGLWSKDNKDKELQPGEINLAGTHLAEQWTHDPFAQLLHIGTSLRDTFDSYYSQEKPGYYQKLESFAKALAGTYADVAAEDVPYISGPLRDYKTYENAEKFRHRGGSELIGSKLRSIVIPQELQRQAKEQAQGYPQPRNIGEDVASGVPDFGLGLPIKSVKQVPQKGNKKYKTQ